jgi:chromosomal replication initiator protein
MTLNLENNSNLLETTWQQSIQQLQQEVDPEVFAAFINPVRFVEANAEDQSITISTPSELIRNHLEHRFSERIKNYFNQKLGFSDYRLVYQIQDPTNTYSSLTPNIQKRVIVSKPVSAGIESQAKGVTFKTNLNPEYTFENFVVGKYNEFAYGLAKQLANSKQNESCAASPLFFHGGVGLGKTHLMQAIGHQYLIQNPDARVYYTSSENFTNKLISSIKSGQIDKFKKQIRSIDLLLIDDFQFLAKKQHTQEEFFHTFNCLHERGSKIVIVADKLPQELSDLDEKLKSRLSWGVTVDFQSPDRETRLAIVNGGKILMLISRRHF